jgi:RNA polymerase sigma-70 factor (ECF subfamily)
MLRKLQNRKEDVCSDDLWPILCEQTADPKETSLEEKITLEQVGELFNELPAKQKAVIGKSQQEVADELSIPLGTVKSRTRLALQRLKDMLATHD